MKQKGQVLNLTRKSAYWIANKEERYQTVVSELKLTDWQSPLLLICQYMSS
jgi:hypothetical protein